MVKRNDLKANYPAIVSDKMRRGKGGDAGWSLGKSKRLVSLLKSSLKTDIWGHWINGSGSPAPRSAGIHPPQHNVNESIDNPADTRSAGGDQSRKEKKLD